MARILIIEDEGSYREALTFMLDKEGFDVTAEADGESGLAEYDRNGADLVLLDLMLPGMPGTEVCRRLRTRGNVAIIMVSARDSETDKVVGLEIGADDYLPKPFDLEELSARILALIRRYTCLNRGLGGGESPIRFSGLSIDPGARVVQTAGGPIELPPKEFDLLLLLARNQGRVLTKQRIYEEVWGEPYAYDDSTIMAIVSRLRKKIEPDQSHSSYIQTVRGVGYRFSREA